MRKFPLAVVSECQDGATAATIAGSEHLDAVVVHRAGEMDGATLVRSIRKVAPELAIVLVSGIDRSAVAKAAGADVFVNFDEWLRIGTVVAGLINEPDKSRPPFRAGDEPDGMRTMAH